MAIIRPNKKVNWFEYENIRSFDDHIRNDHYAHSPSWTNINISIQNSSSESKLNLMKRKTHNIKHTCFVTASIIFHFLPISMSRLNRAHILYYTNIWREVHILSLELVQIEKQEIESSLQFYRNLLFNVWFVFDKFYLLERGLILFYWLEKYRC